MTTTTTTTTTTTRRRRAASPSSLPLLLLAGGGLLLLMPSSFSSPWSAVAVVSALHADEAGANDYVLRAAGHGQLSTPV